MTFVFLYQSGTLKTYNQHIVKQRIFWGCVIEHRNKNEKQAVCTKISMSA